MSYKKCPICEINRIKEDEDMCSVCKRQQGILLDDGFEDGFENVYQEPSFDYMIIKTTQGRIDFCNGSLYEATRHAWKINPERARLHPYVFSVVGGIVREVYFVHDWLLVTDGPEKGRYEFIGEKASGEIARQFLGKRIPPYYRERGNQSPFLYKR